MTQPVTYPAGHGWTDSRGPFSTGSCRVMRSRGPCFYRRDEHDPALPPERVDAFGYRRLRRASEAGEE